MLSTARVMFGYAVEMGELEHNPMAAVKALKETPTEPGILTLAEMRRLFDPAKVQQVWSGDLRHYCANLLAASGACRWERCRACSNSACALATCA
jgi:site-specific recombinase XerD